MREEIVLLIELQKMELEVGRFAAKKKDLPIHIAELEAVFQELCAAVEKEREQLDALRKQRREKDRQLQSGQETLKKARERLFDVKTNKEYQSILKEIETLEEKNSRMEDEILTLLDELDALEEKTKTKEAEFEIQRRLHDEEKSKQMAELSSLAEEIEVCILKGSELRKRIPLELLRKYEQIKGAGRIDAIASVWKEICAGCNMSIPPQLYNELQRTSSLITCPNCSRIIYWENRNG